MTAGNPVVVFYVVMLNLQEFDENSLRMPAKSMDPYWAQEAGYWEGHGGLFTATLKRALTRGLAD